MGSNDLRKNNSGYKDPTAFAAITRNKFKHKEDVRRIDKLINDILIDLDRYGFYIDGAVTFVDKTNCYVFNVKIKKEKENKDYGKNY